MDKILKDSYKYSVEIVQWYFNDIGMFLFSFVDKILRVWDINVFEVVENFYFEGIIYYYQMLVYFSKYSLVVIVCEDFRVYFCDLKLGFVIYILKGYLRVVVFVVWLLRNFYFLVMGSCDNKVFLWDVRKVVGSILFLD